MYNDLLCFPTSKVSSLGNRTLEKDGLGWLEIMVTGTNYNKSKEFGQLEIAANLELLTSFSQYFHHVGLGRARGLLCLHQLEVE